MSMSVQLPNDLATIDLVTNESLRMIDTVEPATAAHRARSSVGSPHEGLIRIAARGVRGILGLVPCQSETQYLEGILRKLRRGNNAETCIRFVSGFVCSLLPLYPDSGNKEETCFRLVSTIVSTLFPLDLARLRQFLLWIRLVTPISPAISHANRPATKRPVFWAFTSTKMRITIATKPYQSKLIPYEDEIRKLWRRRPPVSYARIAELLRQKHGVMILRAAICKFIKVRSGGRKMYAIDPEYLNERNGGLREKPSRSGSQVPVAPGAATAAPSEFRFTPSARYNLTRLPPEEAAQRRKKLEAEGQ